MMPSAKHFYNPHGPDRVAEVSVQPSADREVHMIRLSRGPDARHLRQTALHGPYAEEELPPRFEEIVEDLRAEGFWPGGELALLDALDDPNTAVRARAAVRLGWRRSRAAVGKLLTLLPQSVEESCALLDALGAIGDPHAIPAVRDYAARKLLSRRRSAVEALRLLGDFTGLNEVRERARERLPEAVRAALDAAADAVPVVLTLEPQQQGQALDTLYELATPPALAAVRQILPQLTFAQAHVWRAVKSVLKRSMLRHDYATFGWLAHAVEAQGRKSKGVVAIVKSGYDGQQRQTWIFGPDTQDYTRRLTWRYLRDLAAHRPEVYASAAAEVLIHYTPNDVSTYGPGKCYLLHRILRGGSKRFRFEGRNMVFRPRGWSWHNAWASPEVGEEAFPQLWDAQPRAYLRVLGASPLPEAHVFALRGIAAHPQVIQDAEHTEILALLQAPHEPTVQLGLREIERRFDPDRPDWMLLQQLLSDERPMARTLGQRWLRLTAHLWLRDAELILWFLTVPNANLRAEVVEMTAGVLADNPSLRRTLAERIVGILHNAPATSDAHDGYAQLAREALLDEISGLVNVTDLARWVEQGTPAVKAFAGQLLARRPEAVSELGLERLTALAQHEIASVRAAAHTLLRSAVPQLRQDPSILFVLVESEWPDTRTVAFELLRDRIGVESLGLDGVTGLLDSNRADVQEVGRELAVRHLAELPAAELVSRLVQHPDPAMRSFAMELVVQHLPPGAEALAQLKQFCRAVLFDLWPSRQTKRLVMDFLAARGIEDEGQAAVAAAILGDVVRVQGRADFEHALQALVRIKLAHPQVETTVKLAAGGVA